MVLNNIPSTSTWRTDIPNMHDTYTHSKGWTIKRGNSSLTLASPDGALSYFFPFGNGYDALCDFLLHELGLWQDPDTGLLVLTSTWCRLNSGWAAMIYDGRATRWGYPDETKPNRDDKAVARWRATLAPPSREPKPGEVWRITLPEGQECNALVSCVDGMTAFRWGGDWHPVDEWPADRRRLLVEADGTVVSDD